jgi:hypothetical protein
MKCLFAISMASTVLLFPYGRAVAFQQPTSAADLPILPANSTPGIDALNINSRYRIESIAVENGGRPLPKTLQAEFTRLSGRLYRTEVLDLIERRLRQEFPGSKIVRSVTKGDQPNHVKVRFDLERTKRIVDFSSPRLAFHSQQGFTFAADATVNAKGNLFSVGLVTDNDERVERYTGLRAAAVVPVPAASNRWKFGFLTEAYRSQWNGNTLATGEATYRTRRNLEPSVIYTLPLGEKESLEFHAGVSFQSLDFPFPAAGSQAANAVISTLRYTKQRPLGSTGTQTLDAGYNLRAAATSLASDFSYRRHSGEVRYHLQQPQFALTLSALTGAIDGAAPLFDRFVLGNTRTLRGWNRFDLAPAGGNRMAHFSADGRYQFLRAIYDSGTVWNAGRPIAMRHSAGLGVVIHGFTAMIACPIRNGSIEPVFLLGMNF